jgi:hypothetical protein
MGLAAYGVATIGATAAWLSLGVQAVVDAGTRARVGALPPWWVLVGFLAVAVTLVRWRRLPSTRLWPLTLTLLVCLPWLPGPIPPAFLIWYGPIGLVVWGVVAVGLVLPHAEPLRAWASHPKRGPALLAALVVALSAAGAWTVRERLPDGDEPHYLVITQSLLLDGDLRIANNHERGDYATYHPRELRPDFLQRGSDGEIYSIHAPGVSVLIAPAFALAGWPGAVATLIVVAAATVVLVWTLAWRLTGDAGAAWIAGATAGLTAPAYFHGFTVFPDGPGALAVAVALSVLVCLERGLAVTDRGLLVAGGALAALPWLHTRFAVLAGGLGLIVGLRLWSWELRSRAWAYFYAIPVVSAAAWFGFFWVYWGTPSPAAPYGQGTQSAWAHLQPAIPGLLFDQQFGLLPSAPIFAAALLGFGTLGRQHRRLASELAATFAVYVLVVGSYRMWWGGHSAPARFLVAALPLLSVPLAMWWHRSDASRRALTAVLFAIGGVIVLSRVAVDHGALLYTDRDGVDLLLDWANRSVNLPLAWPSLHRDVPGVAWRDIGIWCLGSAAAVWLALAAARRIGQDWTVVAAGVACAVMLSATGVWSRTGAPVTPDASTVHLLQHWTEVARPTGFRSQPFSLMASGQVLEALSVGAADAPSRLARRAARYGALRVFFFDDNAFMEPPGFWTRGRAETDVFVDTATMTPGEIAGPAVLLLRAGPVPTSAELAVGEWRARVELEPGQTQRVALPDGWPAGWPVHVSTATGFRPADHDPTTKDVRNLGVWVEAASRQD